jgi:hypothetical protein
MFHYRTLGQTRKTDLDAVNLARASEGFEPHVRPSHSQTAAVVALLLVITALMILLT